MLSFALACRNCILDVYYGAFARADSNGLDYAVALGT